MCMSLKKNVYEPLRILPLFHEMMKQANNYLTDKCKLFCQYVSKLS